MVKQRLEAEQATPKLTKAEVFAIFGFPLGGFAVSREIARALREAGVRTIPIFELAGPDEILAQAKHDAVLAAEPSPDKVGGLLDHAQTVPQNDKRPESNSASVASGAGFALGEVRVQFKAFVSSNDSLQTAISQMIVEGQDFCAIRKSKRELHGVITWQSIARRPVVSNDFGTMVASEFMDRDFQTFDESASVFEAMPDVARKGFVATRTPADGITGIVTAAVLLEQMRQLTSPFLQLAQIENELRRLIEGAFTLDEIRCARDPADSRRLVHSASDLSFAEYWRLLENESNWARSSLRGFDRATMITWMKRINVIRNHVMHFRPDAVASEDRASLARFLDFLVKKR